MQREERLLIPTGKERPYKESLIVGLKKVESEIAPASDPKKAVCFYCNTKGHWKHSCPMYLKDLKDGKVEKGGHSGMYMIKLHNTTTSDSWVLDTGCGTHICAVLQRLKESRRSKHRELNLVMGNRKITPVTRIGKTPQLNGVAERRNRILLDMVRSMMCRATLPIILWGYALEIAAHTLNLVPTKKVSKTPFEIWKGKCPSLRHIKIWGCEVFVRREAQYKLEARFKKCLFIGYLEESFGYLFYKPKDNVVFVTQRRVFLEREMISKEDSGTKIDLEEIQESAYEEPIINTNTQQEVVTPVEPDDISLSIRRTKDKISDGTLTELNEPANYKEAMASLEWDVNGSSRRRQTWMENYTLIKPGLKFSICMSMVKARHQQKSWRRSGDMEKFKTKYHFVRSKLEEGHVIVKDIRSEDNPVDPFTKALARSQTRRDKLRNTIQSSAVAFDGTLCLVDQDRVRPIIVDDLSNKTTPPALRDLAIRRLCFCTTTWKYGTSGATILQIHGAAQGNTTLLLRIYNGDMRYYNGEVIASDLYDKWYFKVNLIHNVDKGRLTVYINDVEKFESHNQGPGDLNFKCGVYGAPSDTSKYMESRWRDIKIYKK
ncbi:retrotransposon protein, putative, ty1-copia subclass [Tanacetum coccineum]